MKYALASTTLFLVFLALGIAVEWGGQILDGASAHVAEASPAPALPPGELPAQRYAAVAAAFRAHDLDAAGELLRTLSADDVASAGDRQLLLGLAAWSFGEAGPARRDLEACDDTAGPLGDWRLLALAELAADAGDDAAALDRWVELVDDFPGSPLRPQAIVAAARLYRERGDSARALELVDLARQEDIAGAARVDLEELAWHLGGQLDDEDARRDAARRLLVYSPWKASSLGVPKLFRGGDGQIHWPEVLTPAELTERAASFLELDQPAAALSTLADVAPGLRDVHWALVAADAHVALHQGAEALALLERAPASAAADRAAVEWRRALATADLATARGGGKGLPTAERRRMRARSIGHLEKVVELDGDRDLTLSALRRLYVALDGDFDRQVAVLRQLRQLDTVDRTGVRPLWEKGWNEYGAGNYTAAVAYWTVLSEVYPGDRDTPRGEYWKARALENLGQERRARRLYEGLVAATDTNDLYRTQAMARLGVPSPQEQPATLVRQPRGWQIDGRLRRAKLLADLGLDELARREATTVREVHPETSARDAKALEGLMLARDGQRRRGVVLLRQAFPALGGPAQANVPDEILRAYYPFDYEATIREEARAAGVPASLVAGIIRQESAFDPRATSPVGARGLMQVMPATAREMAQKLGEPYSPARLYDPDYSIRLGSNYIARVLDMFDGNVELALAGYNGGPNRIQRLWNDRPDGAELDDFLENLTIDESRNYVKRILVLADSYRQLYPSS